MHRQAWKHKMVQLVLNGGNIILKLTHTSPLGSLHNSFLLLHPLPLPLPLPPTTTITSMSLILSPPCQHKAKNLIVEFLRWTIHSSILSLSSSSTHSNPPPTISSFVQVREGRTYVFSKSATTCSILIVWTHRLTGTNHVLFVDHLFFLSDSELDMNAKLTWIRIQ